MPPWHSGVLEVSQTTLAVWQRRVWAPTRCPNARIAQAVGILSSPCEHHQFLGKRPLLTGPPIPGTALFTAQGSSSAKAAGNVWLPQYQVTPCMEKCNLTSSLTSRNLTGYNMACIFSHQNDSLTQFNYSVPVSVFSWFHKCLQTSFWSSKIF